METTKKDTAALWMISVSACLYTSLRTEASCTSVDKKSMAQSSSSSLHNRNQTTFSSNEKFARKSYFFSGIFSFLFLSNLVYIVGSIEKHSKNEKFGSNMFFSSIRFKCKQKPHTATLSTNVNILLCHK